MSNAATTGMKTFLAIAILATALFLWQRTHQPPAAAVPPAQTQLTPRPASANNFVKRPLDRAHAVVDQVRDTRKGNERP